METSATDKLERLRHACHEKFQRIERLQEVISENDNIIKNKSNESMPKSSLLALKAKAITLQVSIGNYHSMN
jgi:hypothetical protein